MHILNPNIYLRQPLPAPAYLFQLINVGPQPTRSALPSSHPVRPPTQFHSPPHSQPQIRFPPTPPSTQLPKHLATTPLSHSATQPAANTAAQTLSQPPTYPATHIPSHPKHPYPLPSHHPPFVLYAQLIIFWAVDVLRFRYTTG